MKGFMKNVSSRAKEFVNGKPMAAEDLQQSFCEIAALVKDWSPTKREAMEKMLKGNKITEDYCPTNNTYTIPQKV